MAALPLLVDRGQLSSDETIVCVLSGAGFKDGALAARRASTIENMTAAPFDAGAIAAQIVRPVPADQ